MDRASRLSQSRQEGLLEARSLCRRVPGARMHPSVGTYGRETKEIPEWQQGFRWRRPWG